MDFSGRVVVVTGAGGGLGKEYALQFASLGASVVVNDVGVGLKDDVTNSKPADAVVQEIRRKGGKAVANYDSVVDGEAIINTAIKAFGRVDVVVNNAGILRDKSVLNTTDKDWDSIQEVHLKGSFNVSRAAWKHMKEQKYGKIVMTSSTAGIYGNFGQSNYSAAKMALIGLSNTLAIEGARNNISCNVIVPMAASRLTQDVLPPAIFEKLKPETVAPVVVWLCSEDCQETGGIFEAAGGLVAKYRWERSRGVVLEPITADGVVENWEKICDFSNPTYPTSNPELMSIVMSDLTSAAEKSSIGTSEAVPFSYTQKDAILYAIAVGASTKNQSNFKYVYEGSDNFSVLPTFAIIAAQHCLGAANGGFLAAIDGINIDLSKLLHGEQYLKLYRPLRGDEELKSSYKEVARLDKGSGALLVINVETKDEKDDLVALNQFCIFLVGEGGFGGPRTSSEIVPIGLMPQRPPDVVLPFVTNVDQAALYRLTGDVNPLHIDPDMAALAGFKKPILHGLCSLGIATRTLVTHFRIPEEGFVSIKVRFSASLFPGEKLITRGWVDGRKIFFEAGVDGSGKLALAGGILEVNDEAILRNGSSQQSKL